MERFRVRHTLWGLVIEDTLTGRRVRAVERKEPVGFETALLLEHALNKHVEETLRDYFSD